MSCIPPRQGENEYICFCFIRSSCPRAIRWTLHKTALFIRHHTATCTMQGFKLKQIETFLNLHHPDRKQIYGHLKKANRKCSITIHWIVPCPSNCLFSSDPLKVGKSKFKLYLPLPLAPRKKRAGKDAVHSPTITVCC